MLCFFWVRRFSTGVKDDLVVKMIRVTSYEVDIFEIRFECDYGKMSGSLLKKKTYTWIG